MLIGPIMGPPLGGLIVTHLNWQWIFFLNVPIGVLGVVLISIFIAETKGEERRPLDWRGFFLSGITLSALLFGFEGASRIDEAVMSVVLIAVGISFGALYLAHARRTAHPLLDIGLFKDKSYRLSVIAGSLSRITQGGQALLTPLMFQVGLGMNAAASGVLILSIAVGALIAKATMTPLLRKFGYRNTMTFSGIAISVLYGSWGFVRADWPEAATIALLTVSGFFMSVQFTAYNTIAFENIDQSRMSNASTFYFTLQQMMISVGVCAGALALRASSLVTQNATPQPEDFTVSFVVLSAITLAATIFHLRLPPNAGAGLTGAKKEG
jgi:MFS family permease